MNPKKRLKAHEKNFFPYQTDLSYNFSLSEIIKTERKLKFRL